MSGWFTDTEMAGLRAVAEQGMVTPVVIKRRTVDDESAPSQIYGTDAETFTTDTTVNGWLFSTPSPVITVVGGVQALVNTYRLFLPVGTEIDSGDRVVIEGRDFIVSDTVGESTWLPLLRVSLRRVE